MEAALPSLACWRQEFASLRSQRRQGEVVEFAATLYRHCEERSDLAITSSGLEKSQVDCGCNTFLQMEAALCPLFLAGGRRLLRCARKDGRRKWWSLLRPFTVIARSVATWPSQALDEKKAKWTAAFLQMEAALPLLLAGGRRSLRCARKDGRGVGAHFTQK
ncbi:MAG: hypothetical protein JZU65_23390 [Chlorobium sp.]|nr:hypothetical protein [Chlorobium sp.]